jgi:replication factor C subunit 3/5
LGFQGTTGFSTGPHLHIELMNGSENPYLYQSNKTKFLSFFNDPRKIDEFFDLDYPNNNPNNNIELTDMQLHYIQELFGSDLRSMINYMQTNQDNLVHFKIIHSDVWEELYQSTTPIEKVDEISREYNMDKKHIIKEYLYYIILHHIDTYDLTTLNTIELAIHTPDINIDYVVHYIFNN